MTIPLDNEFATDFGNQIAQLEAYNKHHYRPNSYLHKWWARRCGSTFRLILKHLVTDEAQRDYYAPGGLAGRIILDPMMGGGTTLHEISWTPNDDGTVLQHWRSSQDGGATWQDLFRGIYKRKQ